MYEFYIVMYLTQCLAQEGTQMITTITIINTSMIIVMFYLMMRSTLKSAKKKKSHIVKISLEDILIVLKLTELKL